MADNQIERRPNVLVLDDSDTRATQIIAAFSAAGADSTWVTRSQGRFKITPFGGSEIRADDSKDATLPENPEVILVHVRDAFLLEQIQNKFKVNVTPSKQIFYGGRGGLDPDMPVLDPDMPVKEERIWRSVTNEIGAPSTLEARDILNYVVHRAAQPAILRQPRSFPLLRSLGIACVGYLAVEAAHRYSTRESAAAAKDAYRRLGWFDLPEQERNELARGEGGLLSHSHDVRSTEWWRQFLTAGAGSVENVAARLPKELAEAHAYGLKDASSVRELVKELVHDSDVRPPNLESVELAFQDLVRLEQW